MYTKWYKCTFLLTSKAIRLFIKEYSTSVSSYILRDYEYDYQYDLRGKDFRNRYIGYLPACTFNMSNISELLNETQCTCVEGTSLHFSADFSSWKSVNHVWVSL